MKTVIIPILLVFVLGAYASNSRMTSAGPYDEVMALMANRPNPSPNANPQPLCNSKDEGSCGSLCSFNCPESNFLIGGCALLASSGNVNPNSHICHAAGFCDELQTCEKQSECPPETKCAATCCGELKCVARCSQQ